MKTVSKILASAMVALSPLSAIAHAGHGHDNPLSPGHYANNPEHSLPITLAIATVVVLLTWLVNRKKNVTR
ncbi:MAG: hypothetical protein AABY93_19150 [Bacteroidota bacterium]